MQQIIRRDAIDGGDQSAFSPLPGVPAWVSDMLIARGIRTAEEMADFFEPSMDRLCDERLLHDMDKAVRLIERSREKGQTAVVYGDYDVDGISASAIMLLTLRDYGMKAVSYIPDRHQEGYGLNREAVEKCAGMGGLLITVDCGITSVREVARARELGMTVIVTDHHTLPEELPQADAVIDPLLPPYPFPGLCGAGVAYMLRRALLGPERALECLDLAALATVADMVPLTGENRVLVSLGLKQLKDTARPGIAALKASAGIRPEMPFTSEQIAFQLAPRLNASGRLSSARTALSLLLTDDRAEAEALSFELEQLNTARRQAEKAVIDRAEESIRLMDLCRLRAIVVAGEDFDSGVVGLAAGRIAEKYGYPTVVLSLQGEQAVGSARSAGDIDIYRALYSVRDLYSRFGGHKQAAGLTLRRSDVDVFRERLSDAVEAQLSDRTLMPRLIYDAQLPLSAVNGETWQYLQKMEPFGMGNPEPVFYLPGVTVDDARAVGSDQSHLKMSLVQREDRRAGIAFRMGHMAKAGLRTADILYSPTRNEFRGRVSFECRVSALIPQAEGLAADRTKLAHAAMADLLSAARLKDRPAPLALGEPERGQGLQGTLIYCRTVETARRIAARFPDYDLTTGPVADPRAYNTVAVGMPLCRVRAPFRRVILADGDLTGRDGELIDRSLCPSVTVSLLPGTTDIKTILSPVLITRQELGQVYRAAEGLRQEWSTLEPAAIAARTGLDSAKVVAGLMLLTELGIYIWEFGRQGLRPGKEPAGLRFEDMPVVRLMKGREMDGIHGI